MQHTSLYRSYHLIYFKISFSLPDRILELFESRAYSVGISLNIVNIHVGAFLMTRYTETHRLNLTPRRLEGQYIVPPTNNAEYWYLIGPLECYQPLMTKHLAFFLNFHFSANLERLEVIT